MIWVTVAVAAVLVLVAYEAGKLRGWKEAEMVYSPGADFWYNQAESYRKLAIRAVEIGHRPPPRNAPSEPA